MKFWTLIICVVCIFCGLNNFSFAKDFMQVVDGVAGSVGKYAGDSATTTAVKLALVKKKNLNSWDISVDTRGSVVTLSGFVDNQEQAISAVDVAKKIQGVSSVTDKMQVKAQVKQSAGNYLDDATITSSVKASLLLNKDIPSLDINVQTNGGIVLLTGEVKNKSIINKAEQIVQSIDGVKSVKNMITLQ